MSIIRPVHPDLTQLLEQYDESLVELFLDLRNCILELYPDSNELIYHTHAISTVFSLSKQLKHAFCHIPIYSNHLNLGFNKGALLPDPSKLLKGTGKLIRHIPIQDRVDYRNEPVQSLILMAIEVDKEQLDPTKKLVTRQVLSKIKKK